jgi:anti-sigma regulatory factor (Ser/Thr protein kinase)
LNKLAHGLRLIAENARAAKEQFVANISHELRTPLNMIIGYSEMILQSPLMYGRKIPGSLLADITVIQRNAEHLSHLIDDILDLSQIEAGQMALTKEYISFKEVIEFAITAVKPLYKMKGLYLQSEVPEELPMVSCDRTRIREVLLNLLSNAGRFTEKGGVHVRAWQEGDYLLVSVYDTGPGITGEDQKRLFQPFEQLDSSIHKRFGGTGLGLAISKQFIEMHDGKIWVESQLGTGTTFTFRIPVSSPASGVSDFTRWFSPYISYEQRTHLPKRSKGITHPRFIVLEPNAVLQRLLHRYLSDVEIVSVANMEEVNQELSRSPAQALLINHPSIGGSLEDLVDMQSLDQGMPVIGCYLPGEEDQAANMDVSRILVKPISRAHLIDALNSINVIQGTVLIIDDESDALQLYGRMLTSTQRKYRVLQARDGQEALNLLQEYTPDVILLDLIMPNMSGFQFLEARNQKPELKRIPVIIITARDPVGHPIMSNKLLVTQRDGFSVRQLLVCIRVLSQVLSATVPSGDPVQTINQIG